MVNDEAKTGEYSGAEIVDAANVALAKAGQASGSRLGAVDLRTVRYYSTLGLIGPPRKVGRTAVYDESHLKDLVRIRTLQASGYSLAEIKAATPESQPEGPRRFWTERAKSGINELTALAVRASSVTPTAGQSHLVADGVRLVIDAPRNVTVEQLSAIRRILDEGQTVSPATTSHNHPSS